MGERGDRERDKETDERELAARERVTKGEKGKVREKWTERKRVGETGGDTASMKSIHIIKSIIPKEQR